MHEKEKLTHRFDGQVFLQARAGRAAPGLGASGLQAAVAAAAGRWSVGERECGDEVCAATARFWQGSGRAGMSHRSARGHEHAQRQGQTRVCLAQGPDVDVPPHGRIVIPWDADRDRLARADPAGTATVVVRSLASNHASGARRCRPAILVSPERREGSSGRRRSMQSRQARKRPGKGRSGSAGAADRFVDSSPRGLRAASIHGAVRNEAVGAGSRTIPDCGLGRSAAIDGVGSCCCPVAVRAESRVRRCPKRASDVYSLDSRSAFLAANSSSETMPLALRSPSFSSADRTAEESAVPEDEPWWPCGADCGAGAGLL